MTSLHKTLRHLLAFYGHKGIDMEQAEQDIIMAFVKSGWKAPVNVYPVKWVSREEIKNDPAFKKPEVNNE
jgi:hypothetical protein